MNEAVSLNHQDVISGQVQRQLASEFPILEASQFEQLKQATIAYFTQSQLAPKELFITELQRGQSIVNADLGWQHGAWRLEERHGHLALVRYPERGSVMYFFVVRLAKQNHRWQVETFEIERMWGQTH